MPLSDLAINLETVVFPQPGVPVTTILLNLIATLSQLVLRAGISAGIVTAFEPASATREAVILSAELDRAILPEHTTQQ